MCLYVQWNLTIKVPLGQSDLNSKVNIAGLCHILYCYGNNLGLSQDDKMEMWLYYRLRDALSLYIYIIYIYSIRHAHTYSNEQVL